MITTFEPLVAEKIFNTIDPVNQARLARLEIFELIDSTNSYLLDQARTAPSGWVCFAEQQTAGRGRRGRAWFSVRGSSIMCSLLWRAPKEFLAVSGLSIAIGVMILRALKTYGIHKGIQLKWPNDILYAGRKLAGILLERRFGNIVIGFGLNVNLPKSAADEYIDLSEIVGKSITERNYLSGLILNELLQNLSLFEAQGLNAFRDEWRQHDFLLNHKVTVQLPEKTIAGTALGINEQGELLVQDEKQTHHFCYGEVSVRQLLL